MIELNDEDLLLRLRNFEDNFVERKTSGDSKDWLKTVVAFANSTPVGYPAVLYIGVMNDGTPEEKTVNLDSLQKTFSEKVSEAYPLVYYVTKIVNVDGKQVLAVIVPGSTDRPHFAGQAYVREGSRTVVASKPQFEELIASRNSKAYEILKWKGKTITLAVLGRHTQTLVMARIVVACNQFYVTLKDPAGTDKACVPLNRIEVSFDEQAQRLKLEQQPI
jgi:predicted HTH transcriptional regulator